LLFGDKEVAKVIRYKSEGARILATLVLSLQAMTVGAAEPTDQVQFHLETAPDIPQLNHQQSLPSPHQGWALQARVSCEHLRRYDLSSVSEFAPKQLAEFGPFIPDGQRLVDLQCGNIKGDGSTTYLLVTRSEYEIGTLSLVTRQSDGSLKLEASNKTVIQSAMGAGIAGGYDGITLKSRAFTIKNSFGGGGIGAKYGCTFKYSRASNKWILDSAVEEDYDEADTPHTHASMQTAGGVLEKITFDEFDGTKCGVSAGA
jgi:hypothetical protein